MNKSNGRTALIIGVLIAAPFLLHFGMKAVAKHQCMNLVKEYVETSPDPLSGLALLVANTTCQAAVDAELFPVFRTTEAREFLGVAAMTDSIGSTLDPPDLDPPDTDPWTIVSSTNPLDDSPTVVTSVAAKSGVSGVLSEPVRLFVRCESNKTDVYIAWHDYLGSDSTVPVTVRFPPETARTESHGVSSDNTATFIPRSIPFARSLLTSERLVVQTTPYNESPVTAVFELQGARRAVSLVAEACDWHISGDTLSDLRNRAAQARAEAPARLLRVMKERFVGKPITSDDWHGRVDFVHSEQSLGFRMEVQIPGFRVPLQHWEPYRAGDTSVVCTDFQVVQRNVDRHLLLLESCTVAGRSNGGAIR